MVFLKRVLAESPGRESWQRTMAWVAGKNCREKISTKVVTLGPESKTYIRLIDDKALLKILFTAFYKFMQLNESISDFSSSDALRVQDSRWWPQ